MAETHRYDAPEAVARLKLTVYQLTRKNERLQLQLADTQSALAHMHAVCTEQQAEIARLQAVERQWFRTDI